MSEQPRTVQTPDASVPRLPPKIALSLSGGGYRAAVFHLGAMHTLDHLGLLGRVTRLSTISGGTLTGIAWVLACGQGRQFAEFHEGYATFLRRDDLPTRALQAVEEFTAAGDARTKLIQAFAEVYDRELFRGSRFGELWSPEVATPFQELSFNATDFRHGLPFRFQKSRRFGARIGNGRFWLTTEEAQQIRLADIAAASSCFPGGFEPFGFPHDFVWPATASGQASRHAIAQRVVTPLPLMDGGVVDNQGIDTLVGTGDQKDTLYIFSDANPDVSTHYELPARSMSRWLSGWRLSSLDQLWWAATGGVALGLGLFAAALLTRLPAWDGWLHFPPLLFCAILLIGLIVLRGWVVRLLGRIPKAGESAWNHLKELPLDQIAHLVWLRLTSMFALAGGVFMKRIRGLTYDSVFEDAGLRPRIVTNLIYELNREASKAIRDHAPKLKPSKEMNWLAAQAAGMPTILWFESATQFDTVHLCGRLTMCQNLLDHLLRSHAGIPGSGHADYALYAASLALREKLVAELLKHPGT
jgi:predicted acylesterase/phospholipase RssA